MRQDWQFGDVYVSLYLEDYDDDDDDDDGAGFPCCLCLHPLLLMQPNDWSPTHSSLFPVFLNDEWISQLLLLVVPHSSLVWPYDSCQWPKHDPALTYCSQHLITCMRHRKTIRSESVKRENPVHARLLLPKNG